MITPENIQQTQSFLNIKDTVQRTLILKKDSVKRIEHGFILSLNTSYQRWIEIDHPSEKERLIVKDLIDNHNQFLNDANNILNVPIGFHLSQINNGK